MKKYGAGEVLSAEVEEPEEEPEPGEEEDEPYPEEEA